MYTWLHISHPKIREDRDDGGVRGFSVSSLSCELLFDLRPGCFIGVPLSIGVYPIERRRPEQLHVATAAAPKGTHRSYPHRSRRHLRLGTTKLQARRLRVTGPTSGSAPWVASARPANWPARGHGTR
eukprot:scaffold58745_cov66-Phaeocystis_antarctica.AAC.2